MAETTGSVVSLIRVGQAAEMLGVTVETLRRWETEGRLHMERSGGGQRLVALADVTRLLAERRKTGAERSIVGGSARNREAVVRPRLLEVPEATGVPADPRSIT